MMYLHTGRSVMYRASSWTTYRVRYFDARLQQSLVYPISSCAAAGVLPLVPLVLPLEVLSLVLPLEVISLVRG